MVILTCEQVLSLLPKYIDGKIMDEQAADIERHLSDCSECFEKYILLKNVAQRIKNAFENLTEEDFKVKNDFFKENISAYIDNELCCSEYYNFNKYVDVNPKARKELDEMFEFEQKLKNSIRDNKEILYSDLSKSVVNKIKNENFYTAKLYFKAATTAIVIISLSIACYSVSHYEAVSNMTHSFIGKIINK